MDQLTKLIRTNTCIQDNYMTWQTGRFARTVAIGKMKVRADEIPIAYNHPDIEYSDISEIISEHSERKLKEVQMQAFSFCPIADIYFSYFPAVDTLRMMSVSLDRVPAIELLKDISKSIGFTPVDPLLRLVVEEVDVAGTARFYSDLKSLSKKMGINIKNLFGVVGYNSFLKTQRGIPASDAIANALEKFGALEKEW